MFTQLFNKITGATKNNPDAESLNDRDAGSSARGAKAVVWKPGETVMGRYRIEDVMSGSMGRVYIAEHLGWEVKMAIKAPKPEVFASKVGMSCVLKEANGWINLGTHPNITVCYFVLSIGNVPNLFIEYVDGGNLADWIKTGRCKDMRTSLSLGVQFCHGMEFTHSKGIIHRDIKPQNILVTKSALLKITDFGIIRFITDEGQGSGSLEEFDPESEDDVTVGFRGTPGYAAPEQHRDSHNVDGRCDIFAFGLCLWLMFCGRKPFKNNSLKHKIPEPTAIDPSVVLPTPLVKLLKKTIAFDPDDRISTFKECRELLNAAYKQAFLVDCPYSVLDASSMRAEGLSNRGISLFELNKKKASEQLFTRALEVNDVLPEAIYNLLLLKWRTRQESPKQIRLLLDASLQRLTNNTLLEKLKKKLDAFISLGQKVNDDFPFPEFRLCVPKKTLEFYRDMQLEDSVKRNILGHLDGKRYESCHNVLQTTWKKNGFKKDPALITAYEKLLNVSDKGPVSGSQRLQVLKGNGRPVTGLAYLPGRRLILTSDPGGKILIRNFGSNKIVGSLGSSLEPVTKIIASPGGTRFAAGFKNGRVTVWSGKTGKKIYSKVLFKAPVSALAFSPDDRYLVSGSLNGLVLVNKIPSGKMKKIEIEGGKAVTGILFHKMNQEIVVSCEGGSLQFWETKGSGNLTCIRIIEAHKNAIRNISLSANSYQFLSHGLDHKIKIWEWQSGLCLKEIKIGQYHISSVLMSHDNQNIITGGKDDIIRVWDCQTGECRLLLDGRGGGITSLSPGPSPHLFLSGRKDGAILNWMLIYELQFDY
jgi:serine/threonine protein kinase/WD40 repeat protein